MTFFEARDGEAIRPMLDVAWAPLLGAFSVLFEEYDDEYFVGLCLEGFVRWGAPGWAGWLAGWPAAGPGALAGAFGAVAWLACRLPGCCGTQVPPAHPALIPPLHRRHPMPPSSAVACAAPCG